MDALSETRRGLVEPPIKGMLPAKVIGILYNHCGQAELQLLLHLLHISAFCITLTWTYLKYSIHYPIMRQLPTIRNPDMLPPPAHQMMGFLCPDQA